MTRRLRTMAMAVAVLASVAAAGPSGVVYAPPTDAPVADPFRLPPQPWLAGNRGIEYATVPGQEVRAIGAGVVGFAGRVAGRLVVAVVHADGLRSSYVGLESVLVLVGARVRGGQVIARAGPHLHLGVRRGQTYLDPASLWAAVPLGRVRLVPDRATTSVAVLGSVTWPDPRAARWPWGA